MAISSAASWGSSGVLIKKATPRFSPLHLIAVQVTVGALVSVGVAAVAGQLIQLATSPLRIIAILLGTAVLVMIGQVGFVVAIGLGNVSKVFPITNGFFILFTVLGNILFAQEPITWRIGLGGVMVLTGICLLSVQQRQQSSIRREKTAKSSLLALGLGGMAGLAWAMDTLLLDDVVNTVDPLFATALRMSFMAIVYVALINVAGGTRRSTVSPRDLSVVCLSGVLSGCSSLAFVSALKWSPPATVVVLNSTAPFFAAPLAFILLHEEMTLKVVLGTVSCVAGIVLTLG